ncbi:MAG: SCO family protein [Oligoflexia bacterium]|nr:SCO family protein [Oligoflexia bacterium]
MRSLILIAVSAAFLLLAGYTLTRPEAPPVFGQVPDFSLMNFDGMELTKASLAQKNWLINFFFTSCPKICPATSARLRELAEEMRTRPDFAILSISVDPERDDLAALNAYHARFAPADVVWNFARADAGRIEALEHGLMVEGGDSAELHSGRIILIDKLGQIRGYFRAEDQEDLETLRDILPRLD